MTTPTQPPGLLPHDYEALYGMLDTTRHGLSFARAIAARPGTEEQTVGLRASLDRVQHALDDVGVELTALTGTAEKSRPLDDGGAPALGPCCICEKDGPTVHSIFMLGHRAPIAGRGWGCYACGLAADGAVAVVCDECLGPLDAKGVPVDRSIDSRLRFACRGYPGEDGRIPIGELDPAPFEHDLSKHHDDIVEAVLRERMAGELAEGTAPKENGA